MGRWVGHILKLEVVEARRFATPGGKVGIRLHTLKLSSVVVCLVIHGAIMCMLSLMCAMAVADTSVPPAYQFSNTPISATTHAYHLPDGAALASAIAYIKRLPDGANVCIHEKTVIGVANESIWVEEADRSAGIRINTGLFYTPSDLGLGSLVTITGTMGTEDGERVINADDDLIYDTSAVLKIAPVGLNSSVIMGWPKDYKNRDGDRYRGLLPMGLLVRIWGQVMVKSQTDETGKWYVYLDDGWNMKDDSGLGYTGLRVYTDRIPDDNEYFQVATGVLGTKTYASTSTESDQDFIIPAIYTSDYSDLYTPGVSPVVRSNARITGRVRLIGRTEPGANVRIYSQNGSVVLKNVTDQWTDYTLDAVPVDGAKVTASAQGYLSSTKDAYGNQSGLDFELGQADSYMEIACDKDAIRVCSDEVTVVTAMLRDYEGKGLPFRQIKLTTTMGQFLDTNSQEIVLITDEVGFASARLSANPDGVGVASVRAASYPDEECSNQLEIQFFGPTITTSASSANLSQAGTSIITANLSDSGNPVSNALITFKTSCGLFKESGTAIYSAYTDDDGNANATLSLNTQGTARVLVIYTNNCGQQTINWAVVTLNGNPWYSQGLQYSNPLIADIDGNSDGKKEIVIVTTAGNLVALDSNANVIWSKTMHPTGSNTPACMTIDSDRSGLPCIFIPAETQQKLYGYTHDGTELAGWPVGTNYRFIRVAPALADVNMDGSDEIVAGDECCFVFAWNSTGDWQNTGTAESSYIWRNLTGTPSTAIYGSSCAVGDIDYDADDKLEVVVGTNHTPEVYAFPGDVWGDFVSNPLYVDGWPSVYGARCEASPVIGDIDGDGENDVAVGSDDGSLYIKLSSTGAWTGYPTGGEVRGAAALCDLDGDGKLDVVVGSASGKIFAINYLGQAPNGWAGGIDLNSTGDYSIEDAPVVGDVNGDGKPEVVIGCSDGNLYAIYCDGVNHKENGELTGPFAWVKGCVPPGQSVSPVTSSAVIDDIDNDGLVDVVAGSAKGTYLFRLGVPYGNASLYPWPTFQHDNKRTGCSTLPSSPLYASIQGIVTSSGNPVSGAKIYIYNEDGSLVYIPNSTVTTRSYVLSVGSTDITKACRGSYCINQLDPDKNYQLKVVVGTSEKTIPVTVTKGLVRVDVDF